MQTPSVQDIRDAFADKFEKQDFEIDKNGGKVLELTGVSFTADCPYIFGRPNEKYIERELEWYRSKSLNVHDIPGGPPEIWQHVADAAGKINSNYGWAIYSEENCFQYENVVHELWNKNTRRAVMIYTRPQMWDDYDFCGRSDFMCTNAVQYVIRDNKLNAIVQMRSNDVIFGYRNDYAWQAYVLQQLHMRLSREAHPDLELGTITWQVGSLHVYERDFYLVKHYLNTGETTISKNDYKYIYEVESV